MPSMNPRLPLVHRAGHGAKMLAHRAGFDVYRESFKRRFVRGLEQHQVDTVLDIGANVGQFGAALRQAGFAGRIVSLEPLQGAFAALQRRANRDPSWVVQRAAVGAQQGTLTMNVSGNSVSSSALPMLDRHAVAAPESRYVTTEEVTATTVDALVAEHQLNPESTLLKIDVQGYEQPVLDGAANTLDRFAAVRTEMSLVALYEGQALFGDLLTQLADHGFDMWLLEPGFVEPSTGRLLQVDGVFFRRDGS
jgi:FkbM family methyltransferase